MVEIPFLIIFPLIIALLMYVVKSKRVRNIIAVIGSLVIMSAVCSLVVRWVMAGAGKMELYVNAEAADKVILAAELALMVLVTVLCFKHRKYWISILSIVPTLMIAHLELFGPETLETSHIYIDHLSILMCVIIGFIGGLIVIYALGYMDGYHQHFPEFEDRRNYFLMLLFVFLGAMFGFVTSDNLLWIDFFWEVTSVCSFLLIGYTRSAEAVRNSFRALWMNLLGGTALAIGIVYWAYSMQSVSLQNLVYLGTSGIPSTLIPVALISFAALTKAAQMPFSTWLLGAMVAPTPSSALLHSATMVKAGIYILFRLSPALSGRLSGNMVAFIGGFTFLAGAVMAIAQSDAKKVLAMSTISNLGLMTACAGVGRPETIWAGVFLMMFHSVSKSMLFQDVGATENALHSRDIEDMHGLLYRLPRLAVIMFIGIAGMFLAPFGMLISKWAALKAAVDEKNILLVLFIVFGSSVTSFYWTKWMGKLLMRTKKGRVEDITKKNEIASLYVHAALMIGLCVLFPVISRVYVDPLLTEMFFHYEQTLSNEVLWTLVIVIMFVFAAPAFAIYFGEHQQTNVKSAYMNGVNSDNPRTYSFYDSYGDERHVHLANYYFASVIGQRKLMIPAQLITMAVLIVMLTIIVGGAV